MESRDSELRPLMKVVVALGGNALLRRDEPLTSANQRRNAAEAAEALAQIAHSHTLIVTHGNGPQIGLLAQQSDAGDPDQAQPLDVLGAETDGMIGHLLAQELRSRMPDRDVAVLLTQVRVALDDPAFGTPSKPIGRVYPREEAEQLAAQRGWSIVPDGDGWRRAVPSPQPQEILEMETLRLLVAAGTVVVCGGGGGIPVAVAPDQSVRGVEAVIDKDATSALIARGLGADLLALLTDVDGLFRGFGTPDEKLVRRIGHAELLQLATDLPAGSIGPKARAAAEFVRDSGSRAAIGCLQDAVAVVAGRAGTQVEADPD